VWCVLGKYIWQEVARAQKRDEEVSQFKGTWQRLLMSFLGKVLFGMVFCVLVLIFLILNKYEMSQQKG
jgi:hypothetical protein